MKFLNSLIFPLFLLSFSANAVQKPVVTATIRPLHSILSAIMQEHGTARLLLDQNQSVHHYSLRPSQRNTLSHSDAIFWTGKELESFLPSVLSALPRKVQVNAVLQIPGLLKLEPRSDEDEHGHKDEHKEPGIHRAHHTLDPHVWLSLKNAELIALQMRDVLSQLAPEHQDAYHQNTASFIEQLRALQKESESLKSHSINYIVYHDAYQYFEHERGLKPLIAVSTDEEQAPGVKHLGEVYQVVKKQPVACLIYNTPALPKVAKNLVAGRDIKTLSLDPIGFELEAGKQLYLELIKKTIKTYRECANKS